MEPALADCTVTESAPPLCLSGTVTASGYSAALVQRPGVAGFSQLHQGDSIADWTVSQIGPGYITLAQGDQTARLDLAEGEALAPAPTAAGPIRRGPMRRPHYWEARGEREPKG